MLKENIENRLLESLPVLSAFEIFDPNSIPDRSDKAFKEYGPCGCVQINTLGHHFYQEEKKKELMEELQCEWLKFKYNLLNNLIIVGD